MSSLVESGGRAARVALSRRMSSFADWLRRNGRPLAAYSVEGLAIELEHGSLSSAAATMWGAVIDTLATGADFEWSMNAATRYSVPAAAGTVGYVLGAGQSSTLVQSVGEKRVRSSGIPREQRYKKLRVEPVNRMEAEDCTALDLMQEDSGPTLQTPSSQVPKLSTLARRVIAAQKKKAWLIRHNRKFLAKTLQSKFAYKRIIRAQARRQRFVRRWIQKSRNRIGKKKRR